MNTYAPDRVQRVTDENVRLLAENANLRGLLAEAKRLRPSLLARLFYVPECMRRHRGAAVVVLIGLGVALLASSPEFSYAGRDYGNAGFKGFNPLLAGLGAAALAAAAWLWCTKE